jgi:hypothetical protein
MEIRPATTKVWALEAPNLPLRLFASRDTAVEVGRQLISYRVGLRPGETITQQQAHSHLVLMGPPRTHQTSIRIRPYWVES